MRQVPLPNTLESYKTSYLESLSSTTSSEEISSINEVLSLLPLTETNLHLIEVEGNKLESGGSSQNILKAFYRYIETSL